MSVAAVIEPDHDVVVQAAAGGPPPIVRRPVIPRWTSQRAAVVEQRHEVLPVPAAATSVRPRRRAAKSARPGVSRSRRLAHHDVRDEATVERRRQPARDRLDLGQLRHRRYPRRPERARQPREVGRRERSARRPGTGRRANAAVDGVAASPALPSSRERVPERLPPLAERCTDERPIGCHVAERTRGEAHRGGEHGGVDPRLVGGTRGAIRRTRRAPRRTSAPAPKEPHSCRPAAPRAASPPRAAPSRRRAETRSRSRRRNRTGVVTLYGRFATTVAGTPQHRVDRARDVAVTSARAAARRALARTGRRAPRRSRPR